MQEQLLSFLAELVRLIIDLYAVPVVAALVGWIIVQIRQGKAKLNREQLATIQSVVRLAVQAAEQSGLSGHIENRGGAKLDWAMNEATQALLSLGFKEVDLDLLRMSIEAALKQGLETGLGSVGYATIDDATGDIIFSTPSS